VRNVLLGIVVIVAGLAIGMLSAVVMHRSGNVATPPAAPRVTPLPAGTPSEPQAERTVHPASVRSPAARETSPPTALPSAQPTRTPAPASPTPRPAPTRLPTPAPSAVSTSASTSAPATPAAVNTGFGIDIAQAIVRRYLDAISRGDDATARALLGASPNDATVPLPELSFVNSSAKIGPLTGRRTGDSSAAIQVQVTNGQDKYSIVYEVAQTPKGTLIAGRDITRL
jgi:hypothetical protein